MKKLIAFLYCVSFMIVLASCQKAPHKNKDLISAGFYELGDKGMVQNEEYVFYPFDSIPLFNGNSLFEDEDKNLYSLDVDLRFTDRCKLKNLPLIIEYPDLTADSIVYSKIDINLFDDEDKFLGKGNLGIYEKQTPIIPRIPRDKLFFVSISTPLYNTEGIISLGLLIKQNHATDSTRVHK